MLSPPTSLFGCLGTKTNLSVCPLLRLKCTFSPWYSWCGLLEIYSFFSALPLSAPKLSSIEQSKTVVLALNTHMCKLRSAHSVSVLCQKHISPLYSMNFSLPFLLLGGYRSQQTKSPHKTIYQSRQSRRVLLCQATSVWVLPRITNFTNHSHHYTASTIYCKE